MTAAAGPGVEVLGLDDARWRAFVAGHAEATPFHHPDWADLLAATYGYPGFVAAVPDGRGGLAAGSPFLEVRGLSRRRRWVSLPFTDELLPLAIDEEARRALVLGLAARADRPPLEVRGAVSGLGWRQEAVAVLHELALDSDPHDVRKGFSRSNTVRNISRAQREGVTVRRATGPADLEAFYALHTRTRRRQGVPVQPRRFFTLLWERLIEPGLGTILLADSPAGPAVAGALFLTWNGTTIYKFGASDPEAWPHRPNHLIFWTAIQDACARGDHRLDFGRTDADNAGLRAFKANWGAAERPLAYASAPRAAAAGEGVAARVVGTAIRRGPPWVCRGLGETLYRYAASR